MQFSSKIEKHKDDIKIAIIGCGKFISMFMSQIRYLKKIQICNIVDNNLKRAKKNCIRSGVPKKIFETIHFSSQIDDILNNRDIDIVIEATGNCVAGIINGINVIQSKKNLIMVTVEADVVSGKYLSDLAKKNNVIYSMAYGDQPSLILEKIDWATTNGFHVTCAGKGTKYHPTFEYSTPETVWENYGISLEEAKKYQMNAKMFNSFITGDKSAIEMAAVVNACHLQPPKEGLSYPSVGTDNLAKQLIPKKFGGILEKDGQVEVISSIDRKFNKIKNDLRWGIFIVLKGRNKYVRSCFKEYGISVDASGIFSALWRPYHYIGLELAQSIYSIALYSEPTGTPIHYKADVATFAKKDLLPGEILDGEGGFKVKGKLISSEYSKKFNILPLGLSDGAEVKIKIKKNTLITFDSVLTKLDKQIIETRKYQYHLIK